MCAFEMVHDMPGFFKKIARYIYCGLRLHLPVSAARAAAERRWPRPMQSGTCLCIHAIAHARANVHMFACISTALCLYRRMHESVHAYQCAHACIPTHILPHSCSLQATCVVSLDLTLPPAPSRHCVDAAAAVGAARRRDCSGAQGQGAVMGCIIYMQPDVKGQVDQPTWQ